MLKKYGEKVLANITSREFAGFLVAVVLYVITWLHELYSVKADLEMMREAASLFKWTFGIFAGLLTIQKITKVDKKSNETNE
ncbi:hypothetical protein KAH55_13140 [bacterium]|nr:hypothetical protein [bacterium]